MKLKIEDHLMISGLQEKFHSHFPYLKLYFFKSAGSHNVGIPKSQLIIDDSPISKLRKSHSTGSIEIDGETLVSELEKTFADNFDLNVQVFFKSKDVWLETTTDDNLTLKDLNEKAHQKQLVAIEEPEPRDLNEQE